MNKVGSSPARITTAISMAVVALGAFLPWASFLGYSVSGIEGDGVLTLGAAVIGLAILFFAPPRTRKAQLWISGGLAAAVALVALNDMTNFAAIGIYLTLLGGLVWLGAVIWDARVGLRVADDEESSGSSRG